MHNKQMAFLKILLLSGKLRRAELGEKRDIRRLTENEYYELQVLDDVFRAVPQDIEEALDQSYVKSAQQLVQMFAGGQLILSKEGVLIKP